MQRYMATGRRRIPWEGVEFPGLAKDGRIVPLEISFGEFAREGRRYFTGIAHDITKRKHAERELRESEERYRLLADMIPQNIWTTDAEGRHNYFSRRWYKYSGATPEESLGEGWLQFIHPDDRERTRARWRHSHRRVVWYGDRHFRAQAARGRASATDARLQPRHQDPSPSTCASSCRRWRRSTA